ncbi:hypothetical protein LTS18_002939 [Coniosporium uncinatum]|uniref:Uncharacterized protein n=1 Tax=Coniosporium uncinatum TaxID=93489 RepID=A0ACC3DZ60_9PEZI|nr:hypothetical protein LTS18_002939 [Coniosporium uncinatum]
MYTTSTLLALGALLLRTVFAHGNITSPPARQPGPAMAAACGKPAVAAVMADPTTPLEDVTGAAGVPQCKLDLCRGAMFEDNTAQVQMYSAGDVVNMQAILPIPHEGPMNVSIIDTATNKAIGEPLISFETYADESLDVLPANNTDFSVTMPQLKAGQCTQAGECTMQWFWFGTSAQQTYESCVDFVMMPSGDGAAPVAPA